MVSINETSVIDTSAPCQKCHQKTWQAHIKNVQGEMRHLCGQCAHYVLIARQQQGQKKGPRVAS